MHKKTSSKRSSARRSVRNSDDDSLRAPSPTELYNYAHNQKGFVGPFSRKAAAAVHDEMVRASKSGLRRDVVDVLAHMSEVIYGYRADIETVSSGRGSIAIYINRGDTWATTLVFDVRARRFYIGAWGDIVEDEDREDY
jgi:hypothetical protein